MDAGCQHELNQIITAELSAGISFAEAVVLVRGHTGQFALEYPTSKAPKLIAKSDTKLGDGRDATIGVGSSKPLQNPFSETEILRLEFDHSGRLLKATCKLVYTGP